MIGLAWDHVPNPEPITVAVGGIKDWLACVIHRGSVIGSSARTTGSGEIRALLLPGGMTGQ